MRYFRELRQRLLADAALIYDRKLPRPNNDETDFWRSGTVALLVAVISIEFMVLGVINITSA